MMQILLLVPFRTSVLSILALELLVNLYAPQAEGAGRRYTVDDMLRLEGVDRVELDQSGNTILIEYLPRYDERGFYSMDHGGHVLQVDLMSREAAKPLFKHDPGRKYWLGDASPDGRWRLVFQGSREGLVIGIYDFESDSLAFIDDNLQVNERFEMNAPIWINEHEIIFSSWAGSRRLYGPGERQQIADWTAALRESAFVGAYSGASVSTKPAQSWYEGNLKKYNIKTKRLSVIAHGRFGNFSVNADGTKLAALRLAQHFVRRPVEQLTDYVRFDTQLYIFDLESNESESFLPDALVSMGSLRWSSRGSKLSFFAWDRYKPMADGAHYVHNQGSITRIDIDDFAPSWIERGGFRTLKSPAAAEWLGRQLLVHGVSKAGLGKSVDETPESVNRADGENPTWHAIEDQGAKAEPLADSALFSDVYRLQDGRLLLRTADALHIADESMELIPLTVRAHDRIRILNGTLSDKIDDVAIFIRSIAGDREVGFLDMAKGDLVTVRLNVEDDVVAWDGDRRWVVTRSDTVKGGRLTLRSPDGTESVIFRFNQLLSEIEHPQWNIIKYETGAGGTFSCILLPYNYDPQKAYPTIVDIYPGVGKGCMTESGVRRRSLGSMVPFHNSNDLLSASGYLVVVASNTYERNQVDETLYGGLQSQVDAALDALIAAGMTDPDRIGLWGFSNGSLASLWLATVSARYKGVVPMFGASSPYLEYLGGASSPRFELYMGAPIIHLIQYEAEQGVMPLSMGKSAIADPFAYIRASPLPRAGHICSPILLIQSDMDVFTQFHYEAFLSAVYRLGKRAELVRYYGEGHGLRSPGNIRDFYRRVVTFFDEHVMRAMPTQSCATTSLR